MNDFPDLFDYLNNPNQYFKFYRVSEEDYALLQQVKADKKLEEAHVALTDAFVNYYNAYNAAKKAEGEMVMDVTQNGAYRTRLAVRD